MSVTRATSALIHNHIANHPDVKCNITMVGHDPLDLTPLDFSECADRPEHYAMLHNGSWNLDPDADCAFIFEWSSPRIWEMHSLFLPKARGKKALNAAREMLAYMYEVVEAKEIWGQTPINNRPAIIFNRWLGGKSQGFGDHYNFGAVQFFSQTVDEWKANQPK